MRTVKELLNYNEDSDDSLEDLISQRAHILNGGGKTIHHCGTHICADTAKSLYRLFYLFPKKRVDFSDMYKAGVLWLESACKKYYVEVEFYKYELMLTFWASDLKEVDKEMEIKRQWRWKFEHGNSCTAQAGLDFFELIVSALETEWDVYPGNNVVI